MSVTIENLTVDYGGRRIVDDVTMTVGDGERVGLIGSSGSGKSMISRAVMGLLPDGFDVGGRIDVNGTQVVGLPDDVMALLRGAGIGMIFQNPQAALNPVQTVAGQVELPLKLHYDLTKKERRARVLEMLAKVGLPEQFADRPVTALSGGQQQRVAIATALVTSPRFIIADEPTTALDSTTQKQIVDLLVSLVDGLGASMLFITHDFSVLAHATTRSYVLDDGRIVDEGATADLLAAPSVARTRTLVTAAKTLSLR
ncbi:ABC transporter ATP-binding protein [Bifidobacterium choloepi]|uniref:ABC transporter ATP-binding protein n=1 Tax=Bifidobacterium choloepi TaxID=2614131 RepID=A0A6I5N6N2_9BIFI|nr:ABC transporter ATP-binding protein [Bifidobacterium choloepi]NEG69461.1 ABC transporter ATP-binding protein [Bifidobacterium choloepi]